MNNTDLIGFLHARLDEDERVARAATPAPWVAEIHRHLRTNKPVYFEVHPVVEIDGDGSGGAPTEPDALHIARHDPGRVLREVEAKRQTIDEHALMWRNIGWQEDEAGERVEVYAEVEVCATCVEKHSHFGSRSLVPEGPCKTVRLLALPYSDHPDYREDWKP